MEPTILESYIEAIYGYAIKRTYSVDEADELSQEIVYTAILGLSKLRDPSKFEPWLWGVAENVLKRFRRTQGKQRAMYSYDTLMHVGYEDTYTAEQEEIYDALRTKIAMLSSKYRDIIILHYYDGLSVKDIAAKLHVPQGTVTWRLSEARKKLKKESATMKESALRPAELHIGIFGDGDYNGETIPFPSEYINDALSQNILYHCYEKPLGAEELAALCGVPAYYVEDRMSNLKRRAAVIEVGDKIQTDCLIFSDKHGQYCEANAEKVLMPIMDDLYQALQSIARDAAAMDFYKAEKSADDLFYLYGVLAFNYMATHHCHALPFPTIKPNYDGYAWRYIAFDKNMRHHAMSVGVQCSENLGSHGTYRHEAYNSIPGVTFRKMMYDRYINACEDILHTGRSEDTESVAEAIQRGYILKKEDGSLFVPTPAFTLEQKEQFDGLVEKYLVPLASAYETCVLTFIEGYKCLFPKHLHDDVARHSRRMLLGLYTAVILYAQREKALPLPSADFYCDVLIQNSKGLSH